MGELGGGDGEAATPETVIIIIIVITINLINIINKIAHPAAHYKRNKTETSVEIKIVISLTCS